MLRLSFMAATLTMNGGQEEPFYPLQKCTLPTGFILEDSALFGLDSKIPDTDKTGQNDYTQVTLSEISLASTRVMEHSVFIEWAWQTIWFRASLRII